MAVLVLVEIMVNAEVESVQRMILKRPFLLSLREELADVPGDDNWLFNEESKTSPLL